MNSLAVRWLESYASRAQYAPETIQALKRTNFTMALQSFALTILFWLPAETFLRPTTPPDSRWLSLSLGGVFEVWDIAFLLGAIFLVVATSSLTFVSQAHSFLCLCWLTLGIVWVVGGFMAAPTYLFGAGIFALFIAAQHGALIWVWKAEGVE